MDQDGGATSGSGALLPHLQLDDLLTELQARLAEVLRTRDRVHGLLEAVMAVGSDLDLQTVLRRIVEAAVRLVDAEYGALGVISGNGFLAQFLTVGVDEEQAARIGALPRGHGILGVLIRDPRPLRLDDLKQHDAAYGFPPNHPPMSTFLGVPIRVREEVFGNLYLTEKRGGASFDAEDEAVVTALAAAAGVAIENARLYEATRRRERWVAASGEISTALLSGTDVDDVLPLVATRALELAGADTALVAVPAEHAGSGQLTVEAAVGVDADRLIGHPVGEPGSALAEVRASGKPAVLSAADGPHALSGSRAVGSAVVVPLGSPDSGKDHGLLVVAGPVGGEPVDPDCLAELQVFAAQATVALELAARRREAERLSVYEDRDRIARDLHDVVIQRLFATGMALESASRMLGDAAPAAAGKVRGAVDDLDATIREIRSSIYALQTAPLEQPVTVRSRVLELLDAATEQLGFAPTLQISGLVDTGLPPEVAEQLLAVLREALSNAARHARASSVLVSLDVTPGTGARLVVSDDGIGIGSDVRRSGLANMARRAEDLGGSFEVGPAGPAGGTELVWSVPATR